MDDCDKHPAVMLTYLAGRPLAADEVYKTFGHRKSVYDKAVRERRSR